MNSACPASRSLEGFLYPFNRTDWPIQLLLRYFVHHFMFPPNGTFEFDILSWPRKPSSPRLAGCRPLSSSTPHVRYDNARPPTLHTHTRRCLEQGRHRTLSKPEHGRAAAPSTVRFNAATWAAFTSSSAALEHAGKVLGLAKQQGDISSAPEPVTHLDLYFEALVISP